VTDFVKDLFTDLKESRLWPLAIALVVALVAVPVVLSKPAKQGGAVAPAQPGELAGGSAALAELRPIGDVKAVSASTERKRVRRLGVRNPFEPLKKSGGDAGSAQAGALAGATGPAGSAGDTGSVFTPGGSTGGGSTGGGSTGGGSTGGGSGSGSGSQSVFYYTYVADVTFGKVDETKRRKLQQLRALPSSDLPVIVFMGATADGDKAVFLVGSGADVTGDGTCKPSDEQCVFLYMKPGDSVSIVVGDATGALTTYELKLHEIEVDKLDEPPAAESSSAHTLKQTAQISKRRARAERQERIAKRHARARSKGFFNLFDKLGF
jgi:hypothetical protein